MTTRLKVLETDGSEGSILPLDSSVGALDAGKPIGLDANGLINQNMMPPGVVPETAALATGSAVSIGNLVNIYDDAGVPKIRRADCSGNLPAHGFVRVSTSAGPTPIDVFMDGTIHGLSGLVAGTKYFLGTLGAVTPTAPTTVGDRVQYVGTALNTTSLSFVRTPSTLISAA